MDSNGRNVLVGFGLLLIRSIIARLDDLKKGMAELRAVVDKIAERDSKKD